jgi:acyl-CoA synthetase (AMP-forming)/AMP-acid ligase II
MHWSRVISRNAFYYPREVAIVRGKRTLTFEELDRRANRITCLLADIGIARGDRVALLSHNTIEFVELLFGAWKMGVSVVPINFRSSPQEIQHYVGFSGSKALFVGESYIPAVVPVIDSLKNLKKILCFNDVGDSLSSSLLPAQVEDYETFIGRYDGNRIDVSNLDEEEEALLIFTSGSTGAPKAVSTTHRMQAANAICFAYEFGIKGPDNNSPPGDATLMVTPLYHLGALTFMLSHFMTGASTVIFEKPAFDPGVCLEVMSREKVTCLYMPNRPWLLILNSPGLHAHDWSALRNLVLGSESVPLALIEQMRKAFSGVKISNVYGLTESSGCSVLYLRDKDSAKAPSVGKPFLNVWSRVVDFDGMDVAPGQVGEIILKGDQIVKGYYNNPALTKEAFQDGWFYTGDLATVDEEGFVTIVGRKKDMYISGGECIYPLEIEEVLFKHPKILEAAVVGIADKTWGEAGVAVIVVKPGEQMQPEDVVSYLQGQIARFKVPKRVHFMGSLPRNASGKLAKVALREELCKIYND